jgi:hypothetical protein
MYVNRKSYEQKLVKIKRRILISIIVDFFLNHIVRRIVKLFLSHEVSSYLHYKVLYSYPFLGIISILQCYKIDIKELSSREK